MASPQRYPTIRRRPLPSIRRGRYAAGERVETSPTNPQEATEHPDQMRLVRDGEAAMHPGITRERRVAASPQPLEPGATSAYQPSSDRYKTLLSAPVEDANGRGLSALAAAARSASAASNSGSLAYTAGAALGGALSGLLRPKQDEEQERAIQIEKQKQIVAADAEVEKREVEKLYRAAQAEELKARPGIAEERIKQAAEQAEQNRENRRSIAELQAEVSRLNNTANNATSAANNQRTTDTSAANNQRTTEAQLRAAQMRVASAERVAQWRIKSQKEIASASNALAADRNKLSARAFEARYPGFGRAYTHSQIAQIAERTGQLPEDVAKNAVRQGFAIEPDDEQPDEK